MTEHVFRTEVSSSWESRCQHPSSWESRRQYPSVRRPRRGIRREPCDIHRETRHMRRISEAPGPEARRHQAQSPQARRHQARGIIQLQFFRRLPSVSLNQPCLCRNQQLVCWALVAFRLFGRTTPTFLPFFTCMPCQRNRMFPLFRNSRNICSLALESFFRSRKLATSASSACLSSMWRANLSWGFSQYKHMLARSQTRLAFEFDVDAIPDALTAA